MEESDEFVEVRGDSIIFHRNNIYTGTGYLVCDLKNRTYGFVKDNDFFNVKGNHSPNHCWGLEIDESAIPYKIVLYDKMNTKKVMVNDCGTGTLLSSFASTFSNVPVHWIDNQSFLYASYSFTGLWSEKSTATVTIHKIYIETNTNEIIATIDSVPPAGSNSSFSTDPEGKIIFYCAKGNYVIDVTAKKAIPYTMSNVNNNFFIKNERNEKYGRIITVQNQEIGRVWCDYYNAKTTSGFIGVEYGDIGSNLGYPKGVKVWNNITCEWANIEVNWISAIIGWIEK